MERAIIFITLVVGAIGIATSLFSRDVSAQRADLARLNESVNKSYEEGEYDKAISAGEELLALEQAQKDPRVSKLLLTLANSYRATNNLEKAAAAYKQAITTIEAFDARDSTLGLALERYGCFLRRDGNKADAYAVQRRALSILAPVPEGFKGGPITGQVVQGQPINVPQPKYPAQAKKQHFKGSVSVVVLIGETGKPLTACAESGDEMFAIISEEAAFRARWTPTTLDGIPVRVNGSVIYNFVPK